MTVDFRVLRPWRVGRKVGRTIYAVIEDKPSDKDQLIGMMDNSYLALTAVDDHNAWLKAAKED